MSACRSCPRENRSIRRFLLPLLGLIAAFACPVSAPAQPASGTAVEDTPLTLHRQIDISTWRAATVPFGNAGGWTIRIDQVAGFGCFMAAQYDNAVGIRFQFNPAEAGMMVSAGSTNWRSIREGDRKEMGLSFEGRDNWTGGALGVEVEGMHWLTFKAKGTTIIDELARAQWLALRVDALEFGAYETGEIARAVALLRECQAVADKAVDPFAGKPAQSGAR